MDIIGPTLVEGMGGKRYYLVMVYDYSRYTWVYFIREKSNTFEHFKKICNQIKNEKGYSITKVRSDHEKEFNNSKLIK